MRFVSALLYAQISAATPAADFKLQGPLMQGGMITGVAPVGTVALTLDGTPVKIGLDGAFVIGFGREALPRATLVATKSDGTKVTTTLTITPRAYRIQAVNGVPPRTVTIPPEQEARRKGEIAQIVAARATMSDRRDWQTKFIWPAEGRISGVYGSQRIYNGVDKGTAHLGVDIAGPTGAPVIAPAGGVVTLAAPDFLLEGGLLIIDHGFGIYSTFMHLSRLDVKPGDEVKQGQTVAAIGATGRSTGPHLHWGLNWQGVKLDPQILMPPRPGMKPAGPKPLMTPVPMRAKPAGKAAVESGKTPLPRINPAQ